MTTPSPRLRADAQRNRAALLTAARESFTAGADVSLEGIARTAGVGIGTLYRHFPTREALVESVYAAELEEVAGAADAFLGDGSPADTALRGWMNRYAAFVQAKRGMAETLRAAFASGSIPASHTRATVRGVVERFLVAGAAAGTLRDDVDPDDVTASLVGIFLATAASADTAQRDRMLDLLVDGLRAH